MVFGILRKRDLLTSVFGTFHSHFTVDSSKRYSTIFRTNRSSDFDTNFVGGVCTEEVGGLLNSVTIATTVRGSPGDRLSRLFSDLCKNTLRVCSLLRIRRGLPSFRAPICTRFVSRLLCRVSDVHRLFYPVLPPGRPN